MKYLKEYEDNKNKPEVGDYVIINNGEFNNRPNSVIEYITTHIGQITSKNGKRYIVEFNNPPILHSSYDNSIKNGWGLSIEEIDFFSKDKKDLEHILAANKYNL